MAKSSLKRDGTIHKASVKPPIKRGAGITSGFVGKLKKGSNKITRKGYYTGLI